MVRGQNSESDYSGVFAAGLLIKEPQEPHIFCRASQPVNCLATLLSAPETRTLLQGMIGGSGKLQELSQNLAFVISRRMLLEQTEN